MGLDLLEAAVQLIITLDQLLLVQMWFLTILEEELMVERTILEVRYQTDIQNL